MIRLVRAWIVGLVIVAAPLHADPKFTIFFGKSQADSLYCKQLGGVNCVVGTGTSRYPLDAYGTGPQIHMAATDVDKGGYLSSTGNSNVYLTAGATFDGVTHLAKAATAGEMQNLGNIWIWTADTGLTAGNSFTPTNLFALSTTNAIISSALALAWGSSGTASLDTFVSRRTAATLQIGGPDAASPLAQTIAFQGSRGGTDTNVAGPLATIQPALGTGNAAGNQITVDRSLMGASGTTQQAAAHAFSVCESKTLSNTSATATTIATVGLASNSAGGLHALITVTATDGTNFDSETQDVTVSYVNKAGVITIGTPLVSTSTAANNSGSATIGATVTGASPTISLKVTPVFTTIVPTTVTVYAEIFSHGSGAVACQ